jgi:hypothetical protein
METNQNMERVYELLEQFDFNELSEHDKIYILSIMSEIEYINMRDTLKQTQFSFDSSVEPNRNDSLQALLMKKDKEENKILKFLKLPIQLYKVAASILIILGIYSAIHYSYPKEKNRLLAIGDTIYINKTDTVFSRLVDTVKIIKEKVVFISSPKNILVSNSKNDYDCDKEICPNNVDKIKNLVFNNNVSNDTLWKDFIVSIR